MNIQGKLNMENKHYLIQYKRKIAQYSLRQKSENTDTSIGSTRNKNNKQA